MTNRTWLGGVDNSVYNPDNWSVAGVPELGDDLYLINGTANMKGGDLNGAVLHMGYYNQYTADHPATAAPVLNVSCGARLNVGVASTFGMPNSSTINVTGRATLDVSAVTSLNFGTAGLQINLNHARLVGSIKNFNDHVAIEGTGKFLNLDSSVAFGSIEITPDMIGTGKTSLQFGGHLELGGAVSYGQTISFDATSATLTIDHPHRFHGSVVGPADSTYRENRIELLGIHADSYAFTNDLLNLYAGDRVVESLRLDNTAVPITVDQAPTGVVIGMNLSSQPTDVAHLTVHT
jgi:spore coat protein U-like protein